MPEPTTITITVEIGDREYVRQVQGTHWARDDDAYLYVYNGDTTQLQVRNDRVVEVLREDAVDTTTTIDTNA